MVETLPPTQLTKEAQSAYRTGDYAQAARLFEAARQAHLAAQEDVLAAEMANNRSVALLQSGDAAGALQALEGSEAIFIAANDPKRQALALGNRAAALEALKRPQEAEDAYWQAAEILKQLGENELRLSLMQAISALQLRTGRQLQAVATMHAGLDQIERPTPRQRILKRLLNIPIEMIAKQFKA